jgi:hypothetical protein
MITRIKLAISDWYQNRTRYAGFKIAYHPEKDRYYAMFGTQYIIYENPCEDEYFSLKKLKIMVDKKPDNGFESYFAAKLIIDQYITETRNGGLIIMDVK